MQWRRLPLHHQKNKFRSIGNPLFLGLCKWLIQIGDFIVTEKEWFCDVVRSLKNLFVEYKLIDGNWIVTKLEPKKNDAKD